MKPLPIWGIPLWALCSTLCSAHSAGHTLHYCPTFPITIPQMTFDRGAPSTKAKKKTTCVSGQTVSPKLTRARGVFFSSSSFLLVRYINRGKRSEMVSVVSRYERNEIWIEYIYLPYFLSIKLPYFLGKYKCYTCSIKLKTLILIFGVFQSSTLFMDHQLQLYIQQSQAEHRECRKRIKLEKKKCWRARLELTRALTRDTCGFFLA